MVFSYGTQAKTVWALKKKKDCKLEGNEFLHI